MKTVAEEDKSRSIWPSCPSNGWLKGVDRLTSRPLPSPPDASGFGTAKALLASGGGSAAPVDPIKATMPCTACQCGLQGCSTAEHHGPYVGGNGMRLLVLMLSELRPPLLLLTTRSFRLVVQRRRAQHCHGPTRQRAAHPCAAACDGGGVPLPGRPQRQRSTLESKHRASCADCFRDGRDRR